MPTTAMENSSGEIKKTMKHQNTTGENLYRWNETEFKDIKPEDLLISNFITSITDEKLRETLI